MAIRTASLQAGGGNDVQSVTGTANQVTASPTTGNVVVGLASICQVPTSLAIGGATIGSNALAVTGAVNFSAALTIGTNLTIGSTSQLSGAGSSALSPPSNGTWRMTNNAGTGFTALLLGPSGTAYARLSPTGTGGVLRTQLADGSAFGFCQGKLMTDTNYAAGATTPTGYLVLYDAAGVAYRVPAEAAP